MESGHQIPTDTRITFKDNMCPGPSMIEDNEAGLRKRANVAKHGGT